MLFLSIIIPAYNAQETIIPLLDSIKNSKSIDFKGLEIIIVDDKSKDQTVKKILHLIPPPGRSPPATFQVSLPHIKLIRLKRNSGPAYARNVGVKYAKGKVVLFLDADVVLYKNTLYEILRSFLNDPDLFAMTGVWDKKQRSSRFFPKFKALRDWSYWINERDPKNYYYLFSTRVAAIKRDLFIRLGGFDTTYKHALVEDIELTYRIARRYAVVFNQKAVVHHEFEDFWPVAKKYFWRSFYWSKIYRERKKFDPVATTGKEAVTTVSAGLLVTFSFFYIVLSITYYVLGIKETGNFYLLKYLILNTCYLILIIHLIGVRKFLWFAAREEGVVFAIKSFLTGIALYIVILAGAGTSLIAQRKRPVS